MIALVEYPNRKALLEMVSRPDYLEASEHREAGLEQTVLMATTQAVRPGQALGSRWSRIRAADF